MSQNNSSGRASSMMYSSVGKKQFWVAPSQKNHHNDQSVNSDDDSESQQEIYQSSIIRPPQSSHRESVESMESMDSSQYKIPNSESKKSRISYQSEQITPAQLQIDHYDGQQNGGQQFEESNIEQVDLQDEEQSSDQSGNQYVYQKHVYEQHVYDYQPSQQLNTDNQQLNTDNNVDDPLPLYLHKKQASSGAGLQLFNNNSIYQSKGQAMSQVDNYSEISAIKSTAIKQKIKIYSFFYDQLGRKPITVIREQAKKNLYYYVIYESVIPLLLVLGIFISIYYIQVSVGDFCFAYNVCMCRNYWIRLWSFVKQMILFKLAQIIYRSKLIEKLVMGTEFKVHKRPIMEQFILYSLAISLDLIMTFWIGFNQDWLFVIIIQVVGLIVYMNTFRLKFWMRNLNKGNAYFVYDFLYAYMICFVFWVIPNLLQALRERYGITQGTTYYQIAYPFIDLSLEFIMDSLLNKTQFVELYAHQAQLIIIGVRVGSLMLGNTSEFFFWWALVLVGLFRMNNSSMFITVFVRRQLYYNLPKSFRPITSMNEHSLVLKSKNGACYEHMSWIVFLYFFWISESSPTYYVKKLTAIQDCTFLTSTWDINEHWYTPLVIWGVLAFFEFLGYTMNKKNKYDNIKWVGGQGFNIVENILIRCLGWYMFSMAVQTPLLSMKLSDINYSGYKPQPLG